MVIQIKTVETKKDLRKFVLFPWQVYKKDPYWVPPLISEVESILAPKRNPFWEHAERKLFLAQKDGKIVGRIAGIIDQNYINFHKEQVGFYGFFEVFNDYEIAELLLTQVREWLKKKGMKVMRGPMNPSPQENYGILVQGFDSSPVVMTTYNPKYYVDFMEKFGLRKARDYYAYITKVFSETPEPIERAAKYAKGRLPEIKIRPVNIKQNEEEKEKLKRMVNSIFEELWGFIPMTDKEFDFLVERFKHLAVPELILFAELKSKPVGLLVIFPDYNQAFKKINGRLFPFGWLKFSYHIRKIRMMHVFILGVLKEYRLRGIEALLYHEGRKNAYKLGYQSVENSKIAEDNFLMRRGAETYGGKFYKTYRIYEMEI